MHLRQKRVAALCLFCKSRKEVARNPTAGQGGVIGRTRRVLKLFEPLLSRGGSQRLSSLKTFQDYFSPSQGCSHAFAFQLSNVPVAFENRSFLDRAL